MVGQTQRHTEPPVPVWPNVRQKKKVLANSIQEGQSSVYDTKNTECTTLRGENAVHFSLYPQMKS